MKHILLSILLLSAAPTFAQSAKEMLAEIEGQYELDDLGNVTYTKVFEIQGVSRDEMYSRALNYFVYRYGSGKSVIQTQDKEKGTIVGKGVYPDVHLGVGMASIKWDTWHILRIDIKENKVRVIVTLTEYEAKSGIHSSNYPVGQLVPFKDKGPAKTMAAKAFAKSHKKVQETFAAVERAVKEGIVGDNKDGENW